MEASLHDSFFLRPPSGLGAEEGSRGGSSLVCDKSSYTSRRNTQKKGLGGNPQKSRGAHTHTLKLNLVLSSFAPFWIMGRLWEGSALPSHRVEGARRISMRLYTDVHFWLNAL